MPGAWVAPQLRTIPPPSCVRLLHTMSVCLQYCPMPLSLCCGVSVQLCPPYPLFLPETAPRLKAAQTRQQSPRACAPRQPRKPAAVDEPPMTSMSTSRFWRHSHCFEPTVCRGQGAAIGPLRAINQAALAEKAAIVAQRSVTLTRPPPARPWRRSSTLMPRRPS